MSDSKMQFSLAMSCGYEEFGKLQPNKLKFICADQTLYVLSSSSAMGCFTHATHKHTW